MVLNKEQKEQIELQLKANKHGRYEADIPLGGDHMLRGFVVHPNVLRPENMGGSRYLAKYLWLNSKLYKGKDVIDMGCGSGIQGVVMGVYGAEHVTFSDKYHEPVENTKENVKRFGLEGKSKVVHGDLFENVREKADLISFNHPFFPCSPYDNVPVSRAMLDEGELINRFLREAKDHLTGGGVVVMPFFHMAGPVNNPEVQARSHGYIAFERYKIRSEDTIQKGELSVYELVPRS